MYIDEIIDKRHEARINKDWELSDKLREELDSKNVFVFDTLKGQEVYYPAKQTTREELVNKINTEKRADKIFDAWLYSQKR